MTKPAKQGCFKINWIEHYIKRIYICVFSLHLGSLSPSYNGLHAQWAKLDDVCLQRALSYRGPPTEYCAVAQACPHTHARTHTHTHALTHTHSYRKGTGSSWPSCTSGSPGPTREPSVKAADLLGLDTTVLKAPLFQRWAAQGGHPNWVRAIANSLFLMFSLALKCHVPYYVINNIFNYSTISKCGRNLHAFFPCYFLFQFKWPGVGSQVNRFIQPPRIGITFRRLEIRGSSKL